VNETNASRSGGKHSSFGLRLTMPNATFEVASA